MQIVAPSLVQPLEETVLRDDDFPGGYSNARYCPLAKARIEYRPRNF